MGSIRPLVKKNGTETYHATVRIRGVTVRCTKRTKTQARDWIQKTEAAIKDGRYRKPSHQRHTVNDLIDRFISEYLPKQPKYFDKKVQLLERWKKELGNLYLSDLSPAHICKVRDKLLGEQTVKKKLRTPSTVNRYLAAFSKPLSVALKEWGWIVDNPMARVAKERENKGRNRFLSLEEKDRLLEACRSSCNSYLFPIVLIAILTGMRYGEIIHLEWSDIDFNRKTAFLRNTKNGDERHVPLPDPIAAILKTLPSYLEKGWIFKNPNPRYHRPLSIRKAFATVLKRAQIKDFRFHDLRHTAASYIAMAGASQGTLMAILGHRSPQMTNRYAHFSQDHIRHALDVHTKIIVPDDLIGCIDV